VAALVMALPFTLPAGCADETDLAVEDEGQMDGEFDTFVQLGKADANGIEDHSYEAACVLRLVNTADVDTLDDDAHLWGRAARNIIAYRDGADERPGTADDNIYDDLDELDDVSWVGWFAFSALSKYATNNGYCPKLAEEYVPAGEAEAIQAVIDAAKAHIQGEYDAGQRPALRDAHPKAHGCVSAFVQIENDALPADMRVGVFAENTNYPAWIRYSNGAFRIAVDEEGDIRGMAIKLMGVEGEKILQSERDAQTQDFLLINTPVLMVRNALDYVEFSQKAFDGNPVTFFFGLNPLEWHIRELTITLKVLAKKIASPLLSRYWSTVPYRLGDHAVKYSARPCDGESDEEPETMNDNYLREVMADHLLTKDACFEFMVQKQTDPGTMPIEDPTLDWDEDESPFIKVATITIPAQTFQGEAQDNFCEHLSFTPYHSLPEHHPIGGINRARELIYEEISKLRHTLNGEARVEPTSHVIE